jgi:hypothetical protein
VRQEKEREREREREREAEREREREAGNRCASRQRATGEIQIIEVLMQPKT